MDIWTRLDKLQTKINNELRNTGLSFYVRIDDYNFSTRAFDYKLRRRDSSSSEGKEQEKMGELSMSQKLNNRNYLPTSASSNTP